ncbi:MAG: oxygen-independent coproporphyrinogen III oxidase [Rhizobiales bacterium]|nr:oxygen-independent coproporphyrinogen III oxidase [Hyphomicrobiales bacterium]
MAAETFAEYARANVPRYTSYPTAPHFKPDFCEATYRRWLGALEPKQPISLYLHIPFCRQMCWYCGCNMKLAKRREPVADYVANLLLEIDLIADAMPARMKVGGLHFGGGTPTVLAPGQFDAIMAGLRKRFIFAAEMEAAIECDPRTLDEKVVKSIGAHGFTRVSFGVQEFDAAVQAAINRIQPPEMVERAVNQFRGAGVANVNFDLIYGLPYQTVATIKRTIMHCIAMRPNRIALFGYAHVPWFAKNQRKIPENSLPSTKERAAMAAEAARLLVAAGYTAIGIDHFALADDSLTVAAKTEKLRRNFQGYTTDPAETLIGLGATSIGRTPFGYVQNIGETGAWSRAIQSGRLPVARGHETTRDDRLRARVIEQIMCFGKADLEKTGRALGYPPNWYADAVPALRSLVADGVLTCVSGKLSITADGSALTRIVASAFDRYLETENAKHSVAV